MRRFAPTRLSASEATGAALRQIAIGIFAVVPVLSSLGYMAFLKAFRPHITDIYAGYILPFKSGETMWFFSQQDWNILRGFDLWAIAAVTFALAYYWRLWVSLAARAVRWMLPRRTAAFNGRSASGAA